MPKTAYKKALRGGVRACNNLPQPNPYILVFGGCGRLLHALTPPRSAFLYLQVLAQCHPYILLHFYTICPYTLYMYTRVATSLNETKKEARQVNQKFFEGGIYGSPTCIRSIYRRQDKYPG